jgi:hypothetical protein
VLRDNPAGISDATIPLSQLAAYAPSCDRVIVTENKINFLTLPQSPNVLAIFGGGYAINLVRAIPWLANQPLHYWGDLDTHGFAILSRLRQYFPHTRSFLMDRDTLVNHRDFWTEELSGTRVLRDLPTLDPYEQPLYDDLRTTIVSVTASAWSRSEYSIRWLRKRSWHCVAECGLGVCGVDATLRTL